MFPSFPPSPRYRIDLNCWVLATAITTAEDGSERYHFLRALVRDVSLTGIGLLVTQLDRIRVLLPASTPTVRILLPMHGDTVEIDLRPVREGIFDSNLNLTLVGTRIIRMSEDAMLKFQKFVKDCSAGHQISD